MVKSKLGINMIISFGEIKTDDKFFKKIKILFIKFIKFYLLKANRYQKKSQNPGK